MIKETVFKIIGYEVKTPEGMMTDSVTFWIYAETKEEAMARMMTKGVTCKNYQVTEVVEEYKRVDNTN